MCPITHATFNLFGEGVLKIW